MPEANGSQQITGYPPGPSLPTPPAQPSSNQNPPTPSGNPDTSQTDGRATGLEAIRKGEVWLIWIGVASVIVNAVLGLIYYQQLTQMRIATKASTEATQLASDSLQYSASQFDRSMAQIASQTASEYNATQAAQRAADTGATALTYQQHDFEVDQRPYIVLGAPTFFSAPSPGTAIVVNGNFKNIGHTPALTVVEDISFLRYDAEKGERGKLKYKNFIHGAFADLEGKVSKARTSSTRVRARADTAPGAPGVLQDASLTIPAEDFPKLSTGQVALFYLAIVTYTDAYQNKYQTEFCEFWSGAYPSSLWHICDSNNTIQ